MPRSPLTRTLFAMLPILGALLAAFTALKDWPLPISLLTMAVVASACAVIYWSAPISERRSGERLEQSVPAVPVSDVIPAVAAVTEELKEPTPGSVGTRADALVTGESHEKDLLTDLLGAEAFFVRLTSEVNRCKAANQTAILVVCDIDAFGEINRTVGLVDANRMLRQVAECFRLTVREGDMLSRLGGDEFGIFFPGLPPEIAEARVRDLRAAVREAGLLTLPEGSVQVTACIGSSCFPVEGDTVDTLVAAADRSLARAKRERQENATKPIPSALVLTRS